MSVSPLDRWGKFVSLLPSVNRGGGRGVRHGGVRTGQIPDRTDRDIADKSFRLSGILILSMRCSAN